MPIIENPSTLVKSIISGDCMLAAMTLLIRSFNTNILLMLNTNILVLYTYSIICFTHIFVRLTYVVALIFSINIGTL